MKTISVLLVAALTCLANNIKIGIQAEWTPQIYYSALSTYAGAGVRGQFSDRIAVDLMFSGRFRTDIEADSTRDQSETLGDRTLSIMTGICIKIVKRPKAYLNLNTKGGIGIVRNVASHWANSDWNRTSYNSVAPFGAIGFEPNLPINENFIIYSSFNVYLSYHPETKYVDANDPKYDLDNNILPLKDRHDSKFDVRPSLTLIGMRFVF